MSGVRVRAGKLTMVAAVAGSLMCALLPASAVAAKGAPVLVTASVPLKTVAGTNTAPFDQPRRVTVPAGWSATVWARVPNARLAAVAPDGAVLVSQPRLGQITRLVPARQPNRPPTQTVIASGLTNPQGLDFDGAFLAVAESNKVSRYVYRAGRLSGRTVLVAGLPDASTPGLEDYNHPLKSLTIGRDHRVYFSVGSVGNITEDDRYASPERATVMSVPLLGGSASVYARGVRNGTGLDTDSSGAVWAAVNGRDETPYPYHRDYDGDGTDDYGKVLTDYVRDHVPDGLVKLRRGRDLGWPYCNPNPDVTPGSATTAFDYDRPPFVADTQTNPGGKRFNCSAIDVFEKGVPAHSAALGIDFFDRRDLRGIPAGLLVGLHGSWDRTPPLAPAVAYYPWNRSTGTLGDQQILFGGFQNANGTRWGRPVHAIAGNGNIYVTDDYAGAVYLLTPDPHSRHHRHGR